MVGSDDCGAVNPSFEFFTHRLRGSNGSRLHGVLEYSSIFNISHFTFLSLCFEYDFESFQSPSTLRSIGNRHQVQVRYARLLLSGDCQQHFDYTPLIPLLTLRVLTDVRPISLVVRTLFVNL